MNARGIHYSFFFCFSRTYLQGDLILQSNRTEGLKEAKWNVAVVTASAVTGIHVSCWMTDGICSTRPLLLPSLGLWDSCVCEHDVNAVTVGTGLSSTGGGSTPK